MRRRRLPLILLASLVCSSQVWLAGCRPGSSPWRRGSGVSLPTRRSAEEYPRELTPAAFPHWLHGYLGSRRWTHSPRPPGLNREVLQQSLKLGTKFLLNNQTEAGNFHYQYDFIRQTFDRHDSPVRQAGAVWGLGLLYRDRPEPAVRAGLDRGLAFFFRHSRPGPVPGSLLIAYPGASQCDTGAVALVGLAIIEYLRAVQVHHVPLPASSLQELRGRLTGYLTFLTFMQRPDHHFSRGYLLPTGPKLPGFSPYFDGESMLCLTKAAKYLQREELLPVVERSALPLARAYTYDQWRVKRDSRLTKGFFQWSCMAFWEYQDAAWKNADILGDYVLTLAWWMIHVHHTLRRPRNTAYAYEGMIHAYELAQTRRNAPAAAELRSVIDEGLAKLISWQVGGPLQDDNPFLLAHPTNDPLAVGGVMNRCDQPLLRIDVTQHQTHALILALKYVYPPTPEGEGR